jgi:hypothetical protein
MAGSLEWLASHRSHRPRGGWFATPSRSLDAAHGADSRGGCLRPGAQAGPSHFLSHSPQKTTRGFKPGYQISRVSRPAIATPDVTP